MSKYLSKEEMEVAMKKMAYQGDAAAKLREIRHLQTPHKPEKDDGLIELDGSGEYYNTLEKDKEETGDRIEVNGSGGTYDITPAKQITQGLHWYFDRDMGPEIAAETARQKRSSSRRDSNSNTGGTGVGRRDVKAVVVDTLGRLGRAGSKGEKDRAVGDLGMRRSKSE
ncbi:uncharacterized protein H6S33_011433 [Morchella sextelata]|uniref:uncharacterized protein n=1 Tax=Morchella sextelata TaxID=1174677 RepID=UPI001D0380B6|nr:uncharacterized protein H6S33_011433 [Morchella sextelata]KAH0611006.1 hypothetical protein H6S33_011433 [Morchella sextelata]